MLARVLSLIALVYEPGISNSFGTLLFAILLCYNKNILIIMNNEDGVSITVTNSFNDKNS